MDNTKNRLKRMATLLGITQKEIAEKAHIRESSVSNYVNGISEPGQRTIKKIAEAFNVNASWLMGYGEDTDMYAMTADLYSMIEDKKMSSFDEMLVAAYHDAPEATQNTINILLDLEKDGD